MDCRKELPSCDTRFKAATSVIAVPSSYSHGVFRSCWSAILRDRSFAGGKKRAEQFVTRCWRRDASSTCTCMLLYYTDVYIFIPVHKYAMETSGSGDGGKGATRARLLSLGVMCLGNSIKRDGFRCRVNAEYIASNRLRIHVTRALVALRNLLEIPRGVSYSGETDNHPLSAGNT